MSGRSDERDSVVGVIEDLVHSHRGGSGGEFRDLKGLGADGSIQIDKWNAALAQASYLINEPITMTTHYVVIGDLSWTQMIEPGPETFVLLKRGNDNPEPIWVLGMMSGFVFEVSGVVDQGRRHVGGL
jgi:hypothetical protein